MIDRKDLEPEYGNIMPDILHLEHILWQRTDLPGRLLLLRCDRRHLQERIVGRRQREHGGRSQLWRSTAGKGARQLRWRQRAVGGVEAAQAQQGGLVAVVSHGADT